MTRPTTEIDRAKDGYWNSDPVSASNPGGMDESADGTLAGHVDNFPAAVQAVGMMTQWVGEQVEAAGTLTAAVTAARDDVQTRQADVVAKHGVVVADAAQVAADRVAVATDKTTVHADRLAADAAATATTADRAAVATYVTTMGAALVATSATNNVAIGTGTKTLTIETGKGFAVGMWLAATDAANSSNTLTGQVTSYTPGTGVLVLSVPSGGTTGSGTPANWTIGISGKTGAAGTSSGAVWYGTSGGAANAQTLSGPLASLTGNPSVEWIAGATNATVSRTNLATYSQQLDQWTDPLANTTVTANSTAAPDGTTTADTLSSSATGVDRLRRFSLSVSADSTTRVFSIHAKAGTGSKVSLAFTLFGGTSTSGYITFDLTTGVGTLVSGTVAAYGSVLLPGGWWRLWVAKANNGTNTTLTADIRPYNHPSMASAGSVILWGAQLEVGFLPNYLPTAYIPTPATPVTVSDGYTTLTVGSTAETALLTAAGATPASGDIIAGTKYVSTFDGAYWRLAGILPVAAAGTLGGVKVGTGVVVAGDGTLSATPASVGAFPVSGGKLTGPAQGKDAVTLTDAATIAVNFALSNSFKVTLGGSRTLGFPTNVVAEQSGTIYVYQDGTGGRTLALASGYVAAGGLSQITITTTAGAETAIDYVAESATRIHLSCRKDIKA